ncbi:MAG: hypothetical protein ABI376_02440 [Caulobacteraceae bacterium]
MTIRAVLWDFGDTLADERWMHAPLEGSPDWPEAYRALHAKGLAEPWDLGEITTQDIAAALAAGLGLAPRVVLSHMQACCESVALYPRMMALVARCALPQAIVTINPDIFTKIVVPTYGLSGRFAAIVTSWQEKTLSKADLCDVAIRRLGVSLDPAECLLIDNKTDNVDEWRARGGAAYHFETEQRFFEEPVGFWDQTPSPC